jgi:hypothetical protein
MLFPYIERWPPSYDAATLAQSIRDLVDSQQLASRFFRTQAQLETVCQGDICKLASGVPVIASDGSAAVHGELTYWMVIGNTCDFARDRDLVRWTQLVPLVDFAELSEQHLADLQSYRLSRQFYVPPWSRELKDKHFVADFLRPVAIDKAAFADAVHVVAGLDYYAWVLLHSCLVRFLARDDGRHDR